MKAKRPPWQVIRLVEGEWKVMAHAPSLEEAERLVREDVFGPGAKVRRSERT